jgi:hypothetical protein
MMIFFTFSSTAALITSSSQWMTDYESHMPPLT